MSNPRYPNANRQFSFSLTLFCHCHPLDAYGDKLAKVMDNLLLVSEVATLSRRKPRENDEEDEGVKLDMSFDTAESPKHTSQQGSVSGPSPIHGSMYYNSLNQTQSRLILQHLENWEEPVRALKKQTVSYQGAFALLCLITSGAMTN